MFAIIFLLHDFIYIYLHDSSAPSVWEKWACVMRCSVLQCVAVCCSAVYCSVVCYIVLQWCVAVCRALRAEEDVSCNGRALGVTVHCACRSSSCMLGIIIFLWKETYNTKLDM